MKHSDIQEILDFFSPSPCMLQLICILMRLLVSSLITCRRSFKRGEKLRLHMKGIRGDASKH